MTEASIDNGPTTTGLRASAWIFGAVAFGSLFRLLLGGDDTTVRPALLAWVLAGSISGAYSAACAVLVGVKEAERRLARQASAAVGER